MKRTIIILCLLCGFVGCAKEPPTVIARGVHRINDSTMISVVEYSDKTSDTGYYYARAKDIDQMMIPVLMSLRQIGEQK